MNIDAMNEIDSSYEPFSREPEYIAANRTFISGLGLARGMSILDLACGTGTMTELMLDEAIDGPGGPDAGEAPRVVGLDLSRESLALGQEDLAARGYLSPYSAPAAVADGPHSVSLVEGSADCLPLADAAFDFAIMGNAIQLVSDLDVMLAEINRVLRPGGRFAFNTSFYAGTYVDGTEHVYIRWVQEALEYVRRYDRELRARGKAGVTRKRGQAARAFSRPWLGADEYAAALAHAGLETQSVNERTVILTQSSFEKIGAYSGLARVLLSGYPVALASEALERSAGPALEAVGKMEVPRYWLEMVACKAMH